MLACAGGPKRYTLCMGLTFTSGTATGLWGHADTGMVICCRYGLHRGRSEGSRAQAAHSGVASDEAALSFGGVAEQASFLQRPDFDVFQAVVAGLREHCPPAFPVVVRTSRLRPSLDGYCRRRPNRFVLHLNSDLSQPAAVDTLIHEWAHARAWNLLLDAAAGGFAEGRVTRQEFDALAHGPEFGAAYAEVWRAFSLRILPGL